MRAAPPVLFGRFVQVRPLPCPGARVERLLAQDLVRGQLALVLLFQAEQGPRRAFLAACARARRVEDPALAPVLTAGEGGALGYRAEAFQPGVTLAELLASGRLEGGLAARIAWRLARALQALHGAGLAHGDLGASQVVFDADSRLVLCGSCPGPAVKAMMEGAALPPPHGAPEVGALQAPTPASDLFSYGLMLLHLFQGRAPLAGTRPPALPAARERLCQAIADPGAPLPGVPPPLRRVIAACLQMDPGARPSSMANLIPLLEAGTPSALQGDDLSRALAPRLSPFQRAGRATVLLDARRNLERGETMLAAAGLGTAVSYGLTKAQRPDAVALGRDLLWHSLLPGPDPVRRALAQQVGAMAGAFDMGLLAHLARRRAATLEADEPPPPLAAEKRRQVQAGLRRAPGDDDYLLALAVHQRPECPPSASVDDARLAVARAQDLPATAALVAARALGGEDPDPALFAQLAELAAEAAERRAPAASRPPAQTSPELASALEEDAPLEGAPAAATPAELRAMVEAAQVALAAGDLAEAGAQLRAAERQGAARVERCYDQARALVPALVWEAARRRGAEPMDAALEDAALVARGLGLHDLALVTDRLLVSSLPDEGRDQRVPQLLAEMPESVPLLQAASRAAAAAGDDAAWARHLEAAAEVFLSCGELSQAGQMLMALREIAPGSTVAREGMQRMLALGEAHVDASNEFQRLIGALSSSAGATNRGLQICEGFLVRFPNHVPALERLLELLVQAGDAHRAAQVALDLAHRALLRQDAVQARARLRTLLELDHEHDEALLLLASLSEPEDPPADDGDGFKARLLAREGLFDAAAYHLRKRRRGTVEDVPVLWEISELNAEAGEDPAPPLLEAARLCLAEGKGDQARELAGCAWERAADQAWLAERILSGKDAGQLFPDLEVLRAARREAERAAAAAMAQEIGDPLEG